MTPFEVLYIRLYRSPICWIEVREATLSDWVHDTTEKVVLIRKRLLTAQSRQKNYVDQRKRHLEFAVGDHVFLKVSPKRGLMHFGHRVPRFIRLFEILDRIGTAAYRKYEPDTSHVLDWGYLTINEDATYEERPIRVLDSRNQVLREKTIPLVKVLWLHYGVEEATWECESKVHAKYPDMFSSSSTFI
ncbi:uncharacterized protein LOC130784890 [Actinidia eriantha]|uniref:uncharacterized protein LOC130784890 n=1 Tax=Actinidia eriantha TaxID=165200 RepID=UPI0025876F24|nr:uncharacterized protein LOC130784890 [Actinidia eriantha]